MTVRDAFAIPCGWVRVATVGTHLRYHPSVSRVLGRVCTSGFGAAFGTHLVPSGTRGRDASAIPSVGVRKGGMSRNLIRCCVVAPTWCRANRYGDTIGPTSQMGGGSLDTREVVHAAGALTVLTRNAHVAILFCCILPLKSFANGARPITSCHGGAPFNLRRSTIYAAQDL